MDFLPSEIVIEVLEYCVVNHYGDRNSLLELRTVCKLFDHVLKPHVLHRLQLEFTRLDRTHRLERPTDQDALQRIGNHCNALNLDMMVLRDEGKSESRPYSPI